VALSLKPLYHHAVVEGKLIISERTRERLRKAHYGVYKHATVELCKWTKESLVKGRSCYKFKFYGVPAGGSHRCVEFSPVGMICSNRCVYCWRLTREYDSVILPEDYYADPEDLVEGVLRERRRLLSGYFGHERVPRDKVLEALSPTHWAISLSGEPMMYPKLPKLLKYLSSLPNVRSTFVVTNGVHPEMIEKLDRENSLPTQLYLSMNAPNEELFRKINAPVMYDNSWERWLESLRLLPKLSTRTVVRVTLIRSLNFDVDLIEDFARVLAEGSPHFIEVKSYMHLGYSTTRLSKEDMVRHEELKLWASRLVEELRRQGASYELMDEDLHSRIVVLQNLDRYTSRYIEPGSRH